MTLPNFLITNKTKHQAKYKQIMMTAMKLLGANESIAEEDMNKVLENEKKLAKLSKYEYFYDIYDIESGDCVEVSLEDMNNLLPKVNWIDYVNAVLNNPNVTVNGSEKVLIPGKERLTKMYNVINNMSEREQANLLLWRIFAKCAANFLGNHQDILRNRIC